MIEGERIWPLWKQLIIILLLKKNKDPNELETYRTILLIYQDAKVYTIILAKSMNNFITKYIKENQVGFMLGRQIFHLLRWV